jgi:hypothetical protein
MLRARPAEIGKDSRTLMIDGCVLQSFQIRQIIVDNIQRAVIEGGDGRSALEAAAAEIDSQVSC